MSRRPSSQITGDSPALGPVLPILSEVDRISRVTVCLRPFRAAGPRMDVERVGDKTVIHNYGHGGSGWSLSWGAAQVALGSALTALDGSREIAFYRPMLPEFLAHVHLRNLRLSSGSVDVLLRRDHKNLSATVTRREGDVVVVVRY